MIQYQGEIESILYTVGDAGIELADLADILSLETSAVRQLVEQLRGVFDEQTGGLTLMQNGNHVQLVTKSKFAPLLHQYFAGHQPTVLSQAALETMAIVAYQQPVTRIEIDQIRGVQSSGALQTLLARQMIKEQGRKEAPGRPIIYVTTAYFLNYFNLSSLKELPALTNFETDAFDQQGNLNLFFDQKQGKKAQENKEDLPNAVESRK